MHSTVGAAAEKRRCHSKTDVWTNVNGHSAITHEDVLSHLVCGEMATETTNRSKSCSVQTVMAHKPPCLSVNSFSHAGEAKQGNSDADLKSNKDLLNATAFSLLLV